MQTFLPSTCLMLWLGSKRIQIKRNQRHRDNISDNGKNHFCTSYCLGSGASPENYLILLDISVLSLSYLSFRGSSLKILLFFPFLVRKNKVLDTRTSRYCVSPWGASIEQLHISFSLPSLSSCPSAPFLCPVTSAERKDSGFQRRQTEIQLIRVTARTGDVFLLLAEIIAYIYLKLPDVPLP